MLSGRFTFTLRPQRTILRHNGGNEMKTEKYERTELEIIKFQTEDVISTSAGHDYKPEENELPNVGK